MKVKGKSKPVIIITLVILLFTALAVGIVIKLSEPQRIEVEPQVEKQQAKPKETRPKEESNRSEMTQEDEEFLQWLDEEIARLEEEEAAKAMLVEEKPEDIPAVVEPVEETQESRNFGGWRDVWADLNLTEEEQARLREGFKLAIQRWQNMSPEEREAETARLRAMGERWENMSEEERQEASERMRDRFEQWRQSGDVELPPLSLD